MPYDERLAERVWRAVGPDDAVTTRRMFGGLAFLRHGKMLGAVSRDELMVRVGPAGHAAALARPHVRPMDFTGRPMTGYVYVAAAGLRTDRAVAAWIGRALAVVAALPAARPRKPRRPRPPATPRRRAGGRR